MYSARSTSTCKSFGVSNDGSNLWYDCRQRITIIITRFSEEGPNQHISKQLWKCIGIVINTELKISLLYNYLLFIFVLDRVELILGLTLFKQEQMACICPYNNSLIRYPSMAQIIMCFHLLKVQEWLQSTLMVSEVLENSISNNTELCVILRVETNLK